MPRRTIFVSVLIFLTALALTFGALGQEPSAVEGKGPAKGKAKKATRPPLFFHEVWKQFGAGVEQGAGQGAVSSPNLELKLYGGPQMTLSGNLGDDSNPLHLWTGLCTATCAASLRDKDNYVDLTGLGRIRWSTKTSGLQQIHPIIKLADGTWLAGNRGYGSTVDWLENELFLSDMRWVKLDMKRVVTVGGWVDNPDLSRVDEVGFTDLMPGSGHGQGGWSDVALFEVYGKPVKR